MNVDDLSALQADSRLTLWERAFSDLRARVVLELGVWKGEFAGHMLKHCPVETYYMLDPWRHLPTWNKPWSVSSEEFDTVYRDAVKHTDFAKERRRILRGTTLEVIDQIEDGELDAAYIDGDHTLRGITVDLAKVFPKVRTNGLIGGDDFAPSIWHHPPPYEPTLVFPFAVHFAEGVGCPIVALPFDQFAIVKDLSGFRFIDPSGRYSRTELATQTRPLWGQGRIARMPRKVLRKLTRSKR